MQLRDPKADADRDGRPDGAVAVAGDTVPVAEDGTFSHPAIDRAWAEGYAERNGWDVSDVLAEEPDSDPSANAEDVEICGATMSDGSTCERAVDECQYHSD